MDRKVSREDRAAGPQRLRETLVIAVVAALSMVTKPYVRIIFAPLAGSLGVPVGVFAGCVYMMWVVLIDRLVLRAGAVLRFVTLQAFLALAMGLTNQAGPLIVVTYLAPGLAVEFLRLALPPAVRKCPYSMLAGAVANLLGSLGMTVITVGWKPSVVLAATPSSLLGGAMGGALAYGLALRLQTVAVPLPAEARR